MHLGMTVLAATVHVEQGVGTSRIGLVPLLNVTALAKLRTAQRKQAFIIRAVRRMTVHTVLSHWRVFPQKGPSLLLVARVAFFVNGVRADQFVALCSVSIVTCRALDPEGAPLITEEVAGALQHGFTYVGVTVEAGLRLRLVGHELATPGRPVYGMATQASDTGCLMCATTPEHDVFVSLMATEACGSNGLRFLFCLIRDESRIALQAVFCKVTRMAGFTVEVPTAYSELHRLAVPRGSEFVHQPAVALHAGQALAAPS